ncbi:hypothetical protein [Flavobacterium soli]|uniref:hypothetical protein n=1 Tax=Flavobacterium soli TaxID=344881 RepID=UPI0003FCEF3A|nr:hypothetical protein [Flavobacterium soli]
MTDSESIYEITECICSWYDLLGYGKPLMDANWNLKDKRCESQLKRIKSLDLTHVNKFSSIHRTTSFTLNDGIVLNFDINSKVKYFKNQLVMVLDDLLMEYEGLNYNDVGNGYPGVRGIITYGHRYDYMYAESTVSVADSFTSSFHPRVFQMNTAFSKAYLMESSGSRAGISGNFLYIDKYLIDKIEHLILEQNEEDLKFRVEKNLNNADEDYYFTIFRNNEIFLTLEFDKKIVEYNQSGIDTKLFKYLRRISLQDQLANESAFREGQRYLQMEIDEFKENE